MTNLQGLKGENKLIWRNEYYEKRCCGNEEKSRGT